MGKLDGYLTATQIAERNGIKRDRIRYYIIRLAIQPDEIVGTTYLFGKKKQTAILDAYRAGRSHSSAK